MIKIIVLLIIIFIGIIFTNKNENKTNKSNSNNESQVTIYNGFDNIKPNEMKIINDKIKKAVNKKRNGEYYEALKIWNEIDSSIEDTNPKIKSGKAKVLILLERTWEAKEELHKCLIWYADNHDKKMDKLTKENCIGAINHLGYCLGTGINGKFYWNDKREYLKSIAGQGGQESERELIQRMFYGLEFLKSTQTWCSEFNIIANNIGFK